MHMSAGAPAQVYPPKSEKSGSTWAPDLRGGRSTPFDLCGRLSVPVVLDCLRILTGGVDYCYLQACSNEIV